MRHNLTALGDGDFETLVQSLAKRVIGQGTTTFGAGPDGGREATFSGRGAYPSPQSPWDGEWVLQVKFHDLRLVSPKRARSVLQTELRAELRKLRDAGRLGSIYVLATNVPLTSVPVVGTHDRLNAIAAEFPDVEHFAVWGADEIDRFLEVHHDIRTAYLHLLTAGDLIAQLMGGVATKPRAEIMRDYLLNKYNREQSAQLVQAGDVHEAQLPLKNVFVDLDLETGWEAVHSRLSRRLATDVPTLGSTVSAMAYLLAESSQRVVLIGGPGQGKSTLGQYLSQVHRAEILGKSDERDANAGLPAVAFPRFPFRVALKDFAHWIATREADGRPSSLDEYLAEDVAENAPAVFDSAALQSVVKTNPCLLVLDGLDEVPEQALRRTVVTKIAEFVDRADHNWRSDLQVVATSRPTGYDEYFDSTRYQHLQLRKLDQSHVDTYVAKWIDAKLLDDSVSKRIREVMAEASKDEHVRLLLATPLQVTFVLFIILGGGTPPREREALFDAYVDTVHRREVAKSKGLIRTDRSIILGWHQFVGYQLHRSSVDLEDVEATFSRDELATLVRSYLRSKNPFQEEEAFSKTATQLLDDSLDRLSILVEPIEGRFAFQVRSFQEYFAACHLADSAASSDQRFDRFRAITRSTHWKNVTLFMAGRIGRKFTGEAANLVEICRDIDRAGDDAFLKRGARLALDLSADRSFGPDQVLQRSCIEYALETLLRDWNWRAADIIEQVRRMPSDDVQYHVLPVLEGITRLDSYVHARRVLDVLTDISPTSPLLARTLEQYALAPSSSGAVVLRLFAHVDVPGSAASRARALDVEPNTFATVLGALARTDPVVLNRRLDSSQWSDPQKQALLETAFTLGRSQTETPKVDVERLVNRLAETTYSDDSTGTIKALAIRRAVAEIDIFRHVGFASFVSPIWRHMRRETPRSESWLRVIDAFEERPTVEGIAQPFADAAWWTLRIAAGSTSEADRGQFLRLIGDLTRSTTWAGHYFGSVATVASPYSELARAAISSEIDPQSFEPGLALWSTDDGRVEWRHRAERLAIEIARETKRLGTPIELSFANRETMDSWKRLDDQARSELFIPFGLVVTQAHNLSEMTPPLSGDYVSRVLQHVDGFGLPEGLSTTAVAITIATRAVEGTVRARPVEAFLRRLLRSTEDGAEYALASYFLWLDRAACPIAAPLTKATYRRLESTRRPIWVSDHVRRGYSTEFLTDMARTSMGANREAKGAAVLLEAIALSLNRIGKEFGDRNARRYLSLDSQLLNSMMASEQEWTSRAVGAVQAVHAQRTARPWTKVVSRASVATGASSRAWAESIALFSVPTSDLLPQAVHAVRHGLNEEGTSPRVTAGLVELLRRLLEAEPAVIEQAEATLGLPLPAPV